MVGLGKRWNSGCEVDLALVTKQKDNKNILL